MLSGLKEIEYHELETGENWLIMTSIFKIDDDVGVKVTLSLDGQEEGPDICFQEPNIDLEMVEETVGGEYKQAPVIELTKDDWVDLSVFVNESLDYFKRKVRGRYGKVELKGDKSDAKS